MFSQRGQAFLFAVASQRLSGSIITPTLIAFESSGTIVANGDPEIKKLTSG